MRLASSAEQILKVDPLADLEKIVGKSYKRIAPELTLAYAMQHYAKKKEILESVGDTTFSTSLDRYIEIIEKFGFEKVLEEEFVGDNHGDRKHDTFFVFWHKEFGLLLEFDTYSGYGVNGGKVFYNWIPNDKQGCFRFTSSGGFNKTDVWAGDHDCREGLITNMTSLAENGQLLPVWQRKPGATWLTHYMDHREMKNGESMYDRIARLDAVSYSRFLKLPQHVRDAVAVAFVKQQENDNAVGNCLLHEPGS